MPLNGILSERAASVCPLMTLSEVSVKPCDSFYLPLRSGNVPKMEILRAQMSVNPS